MSANFVEISEQKEVPRIVANYVAGAKIQWWDCTCKDMLQSVGGNNAAATAPVGGKLQGKSLHCHMVQKEDLDGAACPECSSWLFTFCMAGQTVMVSATCTEYSVLSGLCV